MPKCPALLILLFALPLLAQPPAVYRVTGSVVNSITGAPLANSAVHLQDTKNDAIGFSVTADEEGKFLFADLPQGKYGLTAEKRGFPSRAYLQHEQYSTAIAVGPHLPLENLTLSLTPGGEIFGFVYDEANEPVRNATAELFKDDNINGTRATRQAGMATTNDQGRYEFANLPQGSYFVAIVAQPWYAQTQRFTASAAGLTIAPAIANAELDAAYPVYFYPNVTEDDAASPIPIQGGERVQVDFNLVPQPSVHMKIRVPRTDPPSGTSVQFLQSAFGTRIGGIHRAQVRDTEPGIAEISGFPPGHYDLEITQMAGDSLRQTALSLDASVNSPQSSDESTQARVEVTGKIIGAKGEKLQPTGGLVLHQAQPSRDYRLFFIGKEGFSISVPPGAYEVRGALQNAYITQISSPDAQVNGHNVRIEGHAVTLNVFTSSAYGEVEGFVQRPGPGTAQGITKGVPAAMVVLVPDDPANNETLFRRDQSDSDGSFTLAGVVPGNYRLIAIENAWDIEWRKPDVLAKFLTRSLPVRVRPGEHLALNITPQNAK